MILFHGSNVDITEIDLSMSNVGKDFGCGFYLSSDREQALAQARRKAELLGTGTPTLNVYDFDENCLDSSEMSVASFDGYTEEWANFVLKNRRNFTRKQAHDYDIVYGPVANDSVYAQFTLYEGGLISLPTLIQELKTYKLVDQYLFHTEKSLLAIKFIEAKEVKPCMQK